MVKINTIEDFNENVHKLPPYILQDIRIRIGDWMAGGGNHDDPYIKQQFRYAENYINTCEKGEK